MSRAINVKSTEQQVVALCRKHDVTISAIESLPSGGTRVVLMNGDAAATMRSAFGKNILTGTVTRTPLRLRTA